MAKKQLDLINYSKILDMFGEVAARQTYEDVEAGRIRETTLEKYLYDDSESKEEYTARLRREFSDLE